MFPQLLGAIGSNGPGRPRTRPDRGRSRTRPTPPAATGRCCAAAGSAVIPEPDDQNGNRNAEAPAADDPVGFDPRPTRGRNVVERSFNVFKQWRGLATRYDKLALTYRGGVVLCAIIIWLRQ